MRLTAAAIVLFGMGRVDVEVTAMTPTGRNVTRMTGITPGASVSVRAR